jgi:crotonobetainyl-CoA:carnitine CoA-transferase CaiB-like acyl-CoA transferase
MKFKESAKEVKKTMTEDRNDLPLSGIRVLELSHAVMGPTCGLILADMGAEVIKVERAPDGDETRGSRVSAPVFSLF